METSVNNKCKGFTSLEQSRKLAEILPIESADMRYGYIAPYDYSDRMYDGGYDEIPYPKDFLIKNSKKVSIWKHWKDGICGNGGGKQIYLIKMGNTYSLSSCLCFECDYIELSELDNLLFEKQDEQKPTIWSEEDEQSKNWILEYLHDGLRKTDEQFKGQFKTAIAWLEKQKNTTDKECVFRPLAGDTIEKAVERAVKLDGKVVLAFNGAYIPVYNKTKDEIVAEYYDWIKKAR